MPRCQPSLDGRDWPVTQIAGFPQISSPISHPPLLYDAALEQSGVVANNRMNRERRFSGNNSYSKDLRLDLSEFLSERLRAAAVMPDGRTGDRSDADNRAENQVAWLDLCCGRGLALAEAAEQFESDCRASRLRIVGVDLVVDRIEAARRPGVEFVEASLTGWETTERFDLITCVHGLHYVGDKLRALAAAAERLKPGGLFAAHLDLTNLRHADDPRFPLRVRDHLVRNGFAYHARFRRLTCVGPRRLELPWHYLGADDSAGPNHTGQPAVDSWYAERLQS